MDPVFKQQISDLLQRASLGRQLLTQISLQPNQRKEPPLFTASRVSELLSKSRQAVAGLLKERGQADQPSYSITMEEVDWLRSRFTRRGGKVEDGKPARSALVTAVSNQKGGVSKTTTVLHLSQWAALQGQKVLVVDLDSQASFSAFMGINPDAEINGEDTALPILTGDADEFGSRIMSAAHFPGLDYVPACLELAHANEDVLSKLSGGGAPFDFYAPLRTALDKVSDRYDLIFLDCPPHLSLISMCALYAAEYLVVPTGATTVDFASTLKFIDWLNDKARRMPNVRLRHMNFLISNFDAAPSSVEAEGIIRKVLGDAVLHNNCLHSSEIHRAASLFKSVYELHKFIGSRSAMARALESMDSVNTEILEVIQRLRTQNSIRDMEVAA